MEAQQNLLRSTDSPFYSGNHLLLGKLPSQLRGWWLEGCSDSGNRPVSASFWAGNGRLDQTNR